jgi:Membrane domain of glycerophosphoryl diester phosphodiesterase
MDRLIRQAHAEGHGMTVADGSGAQFDFGRVVSRTFGLIGRNFVPFSILSLIFVGAPTVIVLVIQPSLAGRDPGAMSLVAVLASLVSAVAGLVLQGALTRASVDDLSGKGAAIGPALSTGLAVVLPMIGLGIIVGLGVLAGMMLLIIPGIYLALRWAVAAPVLVVEKLGVFASIGRSAVLTENHRWAILGLVVLYVVLIFVLYAIVGLLIPGSGALYGFSLETPSIIVLVVAVAIQVLTSMVATVGGAAIYFELRQIKDGVGVTDLAQVFA